LEREHVMNDRERSRWIATSTGAELAHAHAWVVLAVEVRTEENVLKARAEPILVTDSWSRANAAADAARAGRGAELVVMIARKPLLGFAPDFRVTDREVVVVVQFEPAGHEVGVRVEGRLGAAAIVLDMTEARARFDGQGWYEPVACPMRSGAGSN
jgi:prephenate dehydrogenase